jgi:hypothetical protein
MAQHEHPPAVQDEGQHSHCPMMLSHAAMQHDAMNQRGGRITSGFIAMAASSK